MIRPLGFYAFGVVAAALAAAFPSLTWIPIVAFLILLPLAGIWTLRALGRPMGDWGVSLSRGWLRYLAIGILLGLGIPLLFLVVQQLAGWTALTIRDEPALGTTALLSQVVLRMILVVAIEEFVFRGFFLNALSEYLGIWPAIVLSSLLWGSSHLGSFLNQGLSLGEISVALATFLAWGATLSLCYLIAEKSLWLPYGLHLGVNLGFSAAGWYFIAQMNGPQWLIGHPSWSIESGLIGPIIWSIIAVVTWRLARPAEASLPAVD